MISAFGVEHSVSKGLVDKRSGAYTRDLEGGKTSGSRRTVLAAKTPRQAKRKGAFLARHYDADSPGGYVKPNGEPTPKALQAARWGEPIPKNAQDAARLKAKGERMLASADVTKKLTPEQLKRAKDRARKAGRPYPNAFDNMVAGGAKWRVSKRDGFSTKEREQLDRRKRLGRDLSIAGGTLGMGALALRTPGAAKVLQRAGQAMKLGRGTSTRARVSRGVNALASKEPGATRISNTTGILAIGSGSAGSFNYASQQRLERKRDKAVAKNLGNIPRYAHTTRWGKVRILDYREGRFRIDHRKSDPNVQHWVDRKELNFLKERKPKAPKAPKASKPRVVNPPKPPQGPVQERLF